MELWEFIVWTAIIFAIGSEIGSKITFFALRVKYRREGFSEETIDRKLLIESEWKRRR